MPAATSPVYRGCCRTAGSVPCGSARPFLNVLGPQSNCRTSSIDHRSTVSRQLSRHYSTVSRQLSWHRSMAPTPLIGHGIAHRPWQLLRHRSTATAPLNGPGICHGTAQRPQHLSRHRSTARTPLNGPRYCPGGHIAQGLATWPSQTSSGRQARSGLNSPG